MDDRFIRNQNISKVIKNLRGGSKLTWTTALIGNTIFLAVTYTIILSGGAEGFIPTVLNPGRGLSDDRYDPQGLMRTAYCQTQLYAESAPQSLKSEFSRNQPNPKYWWFIVESRTELIMQRGQSQFKTKYNGALAGLPYYIKKKRRNFDSTHLRKRRCLHGCG